MLRGSHGRQGDGWYLCPTVAKTNRRRALLALTVLVAAAGGVGVGVAIGVGTRKSAAQRTLAPSTNVPNTGSVVVSAPPSGGKLPALRTTTATETEHTISTQETQTGQSSPTQPTNPGKTDTGVKIKVG